jgi:glutamine cyclotransferase
VLHLHKHRRRDDSRIRLADSLTAGQNLRGLARAARRPMAGVCRTIKSRQAFRLPALFCILLLVAACSAAPGDAVPSGSLSPTAGPPAAAPSSPVPASSVLTPSAPASSAPIPGSTVSPLAPALTSPLAPDSTPAAAAPFASPRSAETATPFYTYQVVNTYPHDRAAFTEGLFWDGGYLYESTGQAGQSGIRKQDLITGQVLQSTSIGAQYFGEGIAAAGGRLYELTWTTHIGFVYDQATFKPLGRFTYPTEGWGLTYDGQSLIMSDGSNVLHFMDPTTFTQTAQISVTDGGQPVTRLNELEYIKGQIYANVWQTDHIAIISPQNGTVLAWIDCSGLRPPQALANPDAVLNGIAYVPTTDRLFITGKLWPNLYEIRLFPR